MNKIQILKNVGLGIAIIIALNLFFGSGIKTFYKEPKFEDFCVKELSAKKYENKIQCDEVGGLWNENVAAYGGGYRVTSTGQEIPMMAPPVSVAIDKAGDSVVAEEIKGWCDAYSTCSKNFETADNLYRRNVFIVLVILGVITLIAGFFVGQSAAVSLGLSYGGIISMLIGVIHYWSAMQESLRFIVLGVVVFALIWVGIKKFGKGE